MSKSVVDKMLYFFLNLCNLENEIITDKTHIKGIFIKNSPLCANVVLVVQKTFQKTTLIIRMRLNVLSSEKFSKNTSAGDVLQDLR